MNNDILTKSVNKGIPSSLATPVILRYVDLYNILTDKGKFDSKINRQFDIFLNRIMPNNETFRFMRSFEIRTNPENLERQIIVSPVTFLNSIALNLNYDNICTKGVSSSVGYEKYQIETRLLEERLKVLKKIKTEQEFRREFPFLYEKYISELSTFKPYLSFKERVLDNPQVPPNIKRKYKAAIGIELSKMLEKNDSRTDLIFQNITSPFYNLESINENSFEGIAAIAKTEKILGEIDSILSKYKIKNYINTASKNIEYVVRHMDQILQELSKTIFDFSFLNEQDQNKLELYIAYMYMNAAKKSNLEDKQKCLYYISNYFFEHHDLLDSDLSIHIGQNCSEYINVENKDGFKVTPKSLYLEYRQMLIDNPELRVIDSTSFDFSNMTLEDVNLYMKKYLQDLSATWDFLPPDESNDVLTLQNITTKTKTNPIDEEELKRRIVDMFMDKKEFYGSTNPMFRVKGKDTFDGYIGYIYPNGKVVLDKFYENASRGELAYGNAVYIMNLDDFYELTKLSKTTIIRDKMCKRFVHSGDWKERVRKEITSGKKEDKGKIKAKIISSNLASEEN